MNYTEPAKEVLKKAEKIARELDHPYVGTEHLLLAFMRVYTGVAGQILSANGVEEANLYKRQLEQSICFLQSFGNRTVLQPEYF